MRKQIGDVLLGAVTILALLSAVAVIAFDVSFLRVISGSMRPAISVGDVALVRNVPLVELNKGDVVALPMPGTDSDQYLHRIQSLKFVDDGVVLETKGDSNPVSDQWNLKVTSKDVPVMFAVLPIAGLTNFLVTGNNRTIILSFLVFLLLLEIVRLTVGAFHEHQESKPPLRRVH